MQYLLGLGSNTGDRLANLAQAIRTLREVGTVTDISGIYETDPWGYADQGRFYNMALALETELEPDTLIILLNDLQLMLGKHITIPNGPRRIDIDILLAEDEVIRTPHLTIPHPRMHERLFVLQPLAEIAPLAIHPVLGVTIENLLGNLDAGEPADRPFSPSDVWESVERVSA